jgi:branched-chain amino acid transport system permease protein
MSPTGRRIGKQALGALIVLGVAVGLEFGFEKILPDAAWRQLALFAMVNVIVALSLNVINGMAGQFSIGHAGFVGIGAYTRRSSWHAARLLRQRAERRRSPSPTRSSSCRSRSSARASVAGLFGVVVGLPSLRLKGDYLAIVTLGFAEIFRLVIATSQTGVGNQRGISGLLAKLGGQNGYAGPDSTGVPQYAGPFWIFGAVILCVIIAWRLKFSGWGRALRALREDEIASAAVGVDPTRYKVTSFVIAAVGAGVAGGCSPRCATATPPCSRISSPSPTPSTPSPW